MKCRNLIFNLFLMVMLPALAARAQLINNTVNDSVIALATNVTKNYTFSDPSNGLSVVVAVTMTPDSSSNASPVFSLLDFSGDTPGHLGVDSGLNAGDGNWVDGFEAARFSATLVSVSSGILTNSIQFGITGIGLRLDNGTAFWTSPATSDPLTPSEESLVTLDTNLVNLAGTAYAAQLGFVSDDGQFQISDNSPLAGQSIVFNVTFVEGNGSPQIISNPKNLSACTGNQVTLTAIAYGYPTPTAQWQVETNGGSSFADLPGATNAVLTLNPVLTDSGNQYQVIFTNTLGSATSSVATVNVNVSPATPVISLATASVLPESVNSASTTTSASRYAWTISNGTITSATNESAITYTAALAGTVTLSLTTANDSGCTETTVTNLPISVGSLPGVGPNEHIYVTDDSQLIEQFGAEGNGSVFAYTDVGATGLAFDRAGNLYEANSEVGTIVEFDTNGVDTIFASGLNSPSAIAFNGAGSLYVADYGSGLIWKYAPDGTGSIIISNNISGPDGLAFDRAGNLYVADFDGDSIWKFSTDGTRSLFSTNVSQPCGIAFDPAGNLFVADYFSNAIWKLNRAGDCSIFTTNEVNGPVSVAFDPAGNMFAANDNDGSLSEFTPAGTGLVFGSTDLTGTEFIATWPIPPQLIPPAAATFTTLGVANHQFRFTVTGTVGENYILQTTTNLLAPWKPLLTNAVPFTFSETNTPRFPQQFYRALPVP